MTEYEKKIMLTKDEYEYLLKLFEKLQPSRQIQHTKQINYYFDTDALEMNRKNITCRIRIKNGQYKGIMKCHFPNTDKSMEGEMELYDGLNNNSFIDMGLKLFGNMVTERCIVMEASGCKVVLDKNEYLGTIDYELEVEYDPENEIVARIVFHYLANEITQKHRMREHVEDPVISKATPSKSSRFFDKYTIINQKKQTKLSEMADREECCCAAYGPENRDPDAYLKKYTEN